MVIPEPKIYERGNGSSAVFSRVTIKDETAFGAEEAIVYKLWTRMYTWGRRISGHRKG
jgi:hypothetical protein